MQRKYAPSPESIVSRRQFYANGCGGCAWSIQKNRKWVCDMEQPGYPDLSSKDCGLWRRKKWQKK